MSENPLQENPAQQLKITRITWITLFTGVLVFSAVAIVVNKINGPFIVQPGFEKILLGFAVLLGIVCFSLAPVLFRNSLKKNLTGKITLTDKLTSYWTALVLYLALCEGPALLSVIGFLLTGNYYFGIIVAAGLLGFSVKFPDKKNVSEALQLDVVSRMQIE